MEDNEVMVNVEDGNGANWMQVADIAVKGLVYGIAAGGGVAVGYFGALKICDVFANGKKFINDKINERKEKKEMKPVEVVTE